MAKTDSMLGMYLHLARASQIRRQWTVRDKLLTLAGVQAEEMELAPIAQLCRHKILTHNARHLIRNWPTIGAALDDDRFQSHLKQLKRRYSREKIEHMLQSLGIELARERESYFNDLEYAAALLDTTPEAISAILAQGPTPRNPGAGQQAGGVADAERAGGVLAAVLAGGGSLPSRRIGRWLIGAALLVAVVAAALLARRFWR